MVIVTILLCTMAILGSHIFFILEYKELYKAIKNVEDAIKRLEK